MNNILRITDPIISDDSIDTVSTNILSITQLYELT